jgi:integrase
MNELARKPDALEGVLAAVDRRYRYPARRFVGFLRDRELELGDPGAWRAYLDSLKDLSASSYNTYLAAMKACIRQALKGASLTLTAPELSIIEDEVAALKGKKKPAPASYVDERVCSPEEVRRLIDAANEPRRGEGRNAARPDVALFVEFLWQTGLRISEAIGIRLKSMKPAGEVEKIRIAGKGGRERWAEPPRELIDRIRAHFRGETYLFEHGSRPFTRSHVSMSIHRIGLAVLGREISAHALRHSIATHLQEQTGDIEFVRGFLGHSSIATTSTYYVHPKPKGHEEMRRLTALPCGHNPNFVTGAGAFA